MCTRIYVCNRSNHQLYCNCLCFLWFYLCQIYVCRGYFLSLGIFPPCSFPSSARVTSAHKVLNFRAHRRGGSDILTWFENKYGDNVQQLEVLKLGDVLQEQGVNIWCLGLSHLVLERNQQYYWQFFLEGGFLYFVW